MTSIVVDARGLSCPEPVILTKKAFSTNDAFTVLVDNEVAKENVSRFCENKNAKITVVAEGDDWKIDISK